MTFAVMKKEKMKTVDIVDAFCSNIQNVFKYKIICIQCKFSEDLDASEIGKFVDGTIICTRDNPPKYVMLDNSCLLQKLDKSNYLWRNMI